MARHFSLVILIVVVIFLGNLVVPELVGTTVSGDDAHPISEILFLQKLLRQVLEVALGELGGCFDEDFVVIARELNSASGGTDLALLTIDLDAT